MSNGTDKVIHKIEKSGDIDSIEIGTPSKGGAVKVYGNFDEMENFKKKIDNAIKVRTYFSTELEKSQVLT